MKRSSWFRAWLPALMLLPVLAGAQRIEPAASSAQAGFASERLARLHNQMQDWSKKGWMNGAVALIIRNGKVVFYEASGYKDLEAKKPMERTDIFRIASQTKAITSVAAMICYEEGKFLLDDPVSKYIPAFKNTRVLDHYNAADTTYTTVAAKREVTVRDLLSHTSGIGYAQIGNPSTNAIYAKNHLMAGFYVANDTLLSAMNRLATLPLEHQPGEKFTYGLNTDLLGCLVEIWSGMSLEEFFKKRIFEPLGMKDTYFVLPKEKAARLVNMYIETGGHYSKQEKVFAVDAQYPFFPKTYFSGGAGLSGSIYDYAVFLQMLLNGGIYDGKRILSRNTVRMMTTNQIGDLSVGENKFGLGFSIVTDKSARLFPNQEGTFSWGGAFTTAYWVDPKEKMVTLLYRQMWGTHGGDIDGLFRVLAYQGIND